MAYTITKLNVGEIVKSTNSYIFRKLDNTTINDTSATIGNAIVGKMIIGT